MLIPLSLLVVHFIADFLLQTHWMGSNKSKNWSALFAHTILYSLCFAAWGGTFILITFVTHTVTDAITSRITSRLYANLNDMQGIPIGASRFSFWYQPNAHWFFAVIGADQLIHFATLAYTLKVIQ